MEGSMETLYEYLLENYKPNEPIFLAELQIEGRVAPTFDNR